MRRTPVHLLMLWAFVAEPERQHVPLKHVTGQKASRESGRSQAAQTFKVRVDLLDAARRRPFRPGPPRRNWLPKPPRPS